MPAIASSQNPLVKQIRSLAEKKYRQDLGLFVAEGDKVLERARQQGWEPDILVSVGAAAPWGKARQVEVAPEIMALLSAQKNPPRQLAVFRQKWRSEPPAGALWLALEDMRDPGNLGTIIRTADAAGAAGVILAGQCCDPWSGDCVRATMGSIFAVPLLALTVAGLADVCRSWPGDAVGAHLQGTEDYRRAYSPPVLLVMGSEGRGLSPALADACSVLVRIPMRPGIDSLNVAVAAGLMLFETRRSP